MNTIDELVKNLPDLMDVNQVAEFFKTSPSTIRRLCREGKFPHLKFCKQFRFTKEHIIEFIEKSTNNEF